MACNPYWNDTVFACNFDGSNGSTTFTDIKGATITANGGAQVSTAQSAAGGSSLLVNGGYLSVTPYNALDLSQGSSATLDLYWYPTSTGSAGTLVQTYTNTGSSYGYGLNHNASNQVGLYVREYYVCTAAAASQCTLNTWNHIRLTINRSTCTLYINGVYASSGYVTDKAKSLGVSDRSWIGGDIYGGRANGYIDCLQVLNTIPNYTNFTPIPYVFTTNQCTVSGTVEDETSTLTDLLVRVHRRDTGAIVGQGISNSTTGVFSIPVTHDGECTVTCLDSNSNPPSGGAENALIFDRVLPV